MDWFKPQDKYPKIGDQIIAYYRIGSSDRLSWVAGEVDGSDDGLFIDFDIDGLDFKDVVYWMPIPPLPEGASRV